MKKLLSLLFCLLAIFSLTACENQVVAKYIGGTAKIELKQGERLVNITWKDKTGLWLLTTQNEKQAPQEYEFKENSVFGVLEGVIIIIEK